AGDAARGATAYVSLEPCSHHGRTPPCADALVAAGVARVVVALRDPDPRVDGTGIARLRAAGIEVTTGVLEDRAWEVQAGFLSRVTRHRPVVTLKLAVSLDGRIATATGESRWITGPEARARVHAMRARRDAVMVGGGTARSDDPMLTVRGLGIERQPARVVLSRRGDLPLDGKLVQSAREARVILCHGPDLPEPQRQRLEEAGVGLIDCALDGLHVDVGDALRALADGGINSVFCEGGGALAASLLAADLVDELVVFSAGLTIGAEGTPGIGAMGVAALAEAPRFRLAATEAVGADAMLRWVRRD
ncbi:bifunctional diaminohydroxyphosphoribosylaminopyrimidine deaminase/5-amino-6-(5-phosphoribosylamino)uracil reductase RibD, partial [Rhodobacterales bacterium HKCCE3408]|nr:bifunctional diaminohydroxyphosphoribosylaminopyrimidine deaminase/5-amino-6-(5-phosphoribosylamino)uracil reductase RibD [Rhodobacterales bacterium HKCCE3408]